MIPSFSKGNKVRLPDGREGIVTDVVEVHSRYPHYDLQVKVGDELVSVKPWKVIDLELLEALKLELKPVEKGKK